MAKKVFVSGYFDLLHSGHVAFLQEAAGFGELYVALGSDQTMYDLKGRAPVNSEAERLYMLQALACVHRAMLSSGAGILDFEAELRAVQPDLFIVNEDGNLAEKRKLCEVLGVEYLVLKRKPHNGLPPRSSSDLRAVCTIPYRIDVAGGWLDQPFVSKLYPGPVITISLEPTIEFNDRSGMATSTRRKAIELWGSRLPAGSYEMLAKTLFAYDNPPGTAEVSGSQDTIGIVYPGLNKAQYCGEYWPAHIESVQDEATLGFIERALHLAPLSPRHATYRALGRTQITLEGAKALSEAAEGCWEAILRRDIVAFGDYFRRSFEAQIAMFPNMMNDAVAELIEQYRGRALGWKLSGAGGGGYLILV
ncbi:MAG: adenylyltransferase/cytidyltransferase family protein, partial [Chloroflexi bacterium]|nr:adenylyltransferase/cytidyltransferase family protein [Chloroflexota bacterium]